MPAVKKTLGKPSNEDDHEHVSCRYFAIVVEKPSSARKQASQGWAKMDFNWEPMIHNQCIYDSVQRDPSHLCHTEKRDGASSWHIAVVEQGIEGQYSMTCILL